MPKTKKSIHQVGEERGDVGRKADRCTEVQADFAAILGSLLAREWAKQHAKSAIDTDAAKSRPTNLGDIA